MRVHKTSRMRRRPLLSFLACVLILTCLVTFAKADTSDPSSPRDPGRTPVATDSGPVVTTVSSTSSSSSSSSSALASSSAPNSTMTSTSCREDPSCPMHCANDDCASRNLSCILGVQMSCGACVKSWCGKNPLSNLTPDPDSNSDNSNSAMIGGLVGGMVGVITLAFGGYIGFRYYKRKKAGLPFFGVDKSDESWDGMDVGSGLNVSHQSAVIPIGYFPGSNTNSIVVTDPNGLQSSPAVLTPPQPTFSRGVDRTSVRSENPFDDLEDEDAVEVKRAVVVTTTPLLPLPGSTPSASQTNVHIHSSASSERQVSVIPDQHSEYMNPTYSMIVDSLFPEAQGGDRDSMASSVVISSGVAKLTSTSASTMTVSNAGLGSATPAIPPLPTAKPTLVRVDTLSRNNSTSSRRYPVSNATPGSTPATSTTSLAFSSVPATPSRFNHGASSESSRPNPPNLLIQNPSTSNLSISEESPFSDRHSISDTTDEGEFVRPSVSSSPAQSRPETQLLAPQNFADRQRLPTDSMASSSNSLYGSDGEIPIFWGADDPRRSAAESEASSSTWPRDTMATERVISFAETETSRERDTRVISFAESDSSRARDTIATNDHGRVISLFGEEDEDLR